MWLLTSLIAVSTLLFLFWGGPLWTAPRGSSHVARFAVSYLAVVPAAAALLATRGAFSLARLAAASGFAWAIKMVITAVLYNAVAPGTGSALEPRPAPSTPAPALASHRYRPAGGDFARGAVEGTVHRRGRPVEAIIFAVRPPPGLPPPAPAAHELAVRGSAYAQPLVVTHLRDSLTARNDDAVLHTLRLSLDGRLEASRPLPPGSAAVPVPLPRAGLYRLSCANHPSEDGWLLAADHPYLARSGADGRFRMESVPAGPLTLAAVALQPDGMWRSEVALEVGAGSVARGVSMDLGAGHTLAALSQPEQEMTR